MGKTTVAKVLFGKLFSQFDSCCFFEIGREEYNRNGFNYMRDKLLSMLLKENFCNNTPGTPPFEFTMRRLSSIRVFIVFDGVIDSRELLEYLRQVCNCLGANSKVIITSRDKHVLTILGVHHEMIYKVRELNHENSLQLFRLNAFNENHPHRGYGEIIDKLVCYASGLPLALKVLGSFLLSKSMKEWESALVKFKKYPHDDIQKVLRLSYDGLDHIEKQILLDIACFLKDKHIEDVICLYELGGDIGIRSLEDKALITIGYDHCVHMHDLIQEMGLSFVCEESIKNPEKRSRLWDSEEVYDVLKFNKVRKRFF